MISQDTFAYGGADRGRWRRHLSAAVERSLDTVDTAILLRGSSADGHHWGSKGANPVYGCLTRSTKD